MDRTHDPTRPPTLRPAPASVTRYHRGGVLVTGGWLVVTGRRYAIGELRQLRTARGPRERIVLPAALASGVIALVILITARFLDTAGWIGAGIVLAVPLIVLAGGLLRRPRPYQLWAEYRGMTVALLWETNPERYHQICRAVLRAREQAADA